MDLKYTKFNCIKSILYRHNFFRNIVSPVHNTTVTVCRLEESPRQIICHFKGEIISRIFSPLHVVKFVEKVPAFFSELWSKPITT